MRRLLVALMTMAVASPSFAQVAQITANPKNISGGAQSPQFTVPVNLDGTLAATGSASAPVATQGNVASGATDAGNPVKVGCVYNSTVITVTTGQRADCQANANGLLRVIPSVVAAAAADGFSNGLVGFNYRSSDFASALPATGTYLFNGSTWDRQRGDLFGTYSVAAPSTAAATALAPASTSTVAGSLVLKASAGNLYSWRVTAGASAGYVLVFNATSAPADGAVTPADCVAVAANSTVGSTAIIPERYTTGITLVFSTTGCLLKTISATAFIRGTAL